MSDFNDFKFTKLENQLQLQSAQEQGKIIILQEKENGKNQGILQECGAKETKSSQETSNQATEGIRGNRGANRANPSNSPDCQRQGTGNDSPFARIRKEWVEGSGVHEDIVRLNVQYLEKYQPYEHLCYSDKIKRLNTGRLPGWILKKYQHIEAGGWWCDSGNGLWGCFKPDKPRIDATKGKFVKYEHPLMEPTGIFTLRVTQAISAKIFERCGLDPLDEDFTPGKQEDENLWKLVEDDQGIPIILTEGAKKAGALLSAGFAAIALPGIWGAVRRGEDGKHTLIPQLEKFAQKGREIYFAFDQDEKRKTRKANRKALFATGRLLKSFGCKVKIVEWEPTIKGVDDLIVSSGEQHFLKCYEKALSFDNWSADWLRLLTYKPALKLDRSSKYIGEFSPPPGAKLICLKAPKNSGKTEWLVKICAQAQYRGQKVLVLTHRTQLGLELARRFGIDYVSELKDSDTQGIFGIGLCFDSLRKNSQAKFDPEDWHGCIIIIDEAEQALWHLLNAKTEVAKYRVQILRDFQQVIKNAFAGEGGQVFLSDADLSDVSIDYIKNLSESPIEPWVVVKEGNPTPWNVTVWEKVEDLVARIECEIRDGGKVLVFVDGQKAKSKWGTKNFEAYLTKQFPNKKILRIDAESVTDPTHPAYGCITKLNQIAAEYDIVIASPTIETGVSIDLKGHFTAVFDIAQGVIPVSSVLQRMARLREPVPRHIWAKSFGIGTLGNGSASLKSLRDSQDGKFKAHIRFLGQTDLPENFDFEGVSNFQPASMWTWVKMAARINLGMQRYRHEIIRGLIREGHNVRLGTPEELEELCAPPKQTILDGISASRDKIYYQYKDEVATAPNLEDEKFSKLQAKRERTARELILLRKGRLSRRYSPELASKSELIEADDRGDYSKMRLHYFLSFGRDFLAERDRHIASTQFEKFGDFFLPDINSRLMGGKILLLERLGIQNLLQQEIEWANSSPFLVELKQTALKYNSLIKDILSITIKEKDSPIAIAQKFLGLFALKLCNPKKKGARGQQQRYYQSPEIPQLRQGIFRVWLERDRAAQASKLAAEASVPVTTPATGLDIGDLKPDLAFDTTERTTKCGNHTGNNIYSSSGVLTGDSVATESLTPLEIFVESLAAVKTQQEFWKVVEGRQDEEIKVALLFQDVPHRYQLQAWYEAPVPVSTPATALNIGDLNSVSDSASDTTDEPTKCGSHTGNNIYSSPSLATSDVPTGDSVATSPIAQPAPKKTVVIPQRLRQAAASVVAAATIALSGLPAAAAPEPQNLQAAKPAEISQAEKSQPEKSQAEKSHWDELPKPGMLVRWLGCKGTEKLVLRNIDPDGRCQVVSLSSGRFANTHIAQLKPANLG
jgi:hypothetical protein